MKPKEKLTGMGILPFYTKAQSDRLMTNIMVESDLFGKVVGFENHGGRTYHNLTTLGKVIKGFGNNEESGEEGLHYLSLIGTYLHGPILPKNRKIADYLIEKAYERKTGRKLEPLDDEMDRPFGKDSGIVNGRNIRMKTEKRIRYLKESLDFKLYFCVFLNERLKRTLSKCGMLFKSVSFDQLST